jgi:hypothetical protein
VNTEKTKSLGGPAVKGNDRSEPSSHSSLRIHHDIITLDFEIKGGIKMDFYLLEPDLRIAGLQAVGQIPDFLEPLEWISGRKMPAPPAPLKLQLAQNSGDAITDIMGSLLTLFSNNLKNALDRFGVNNIDYFPVEFSNAESERLRHGWWLANVVGLFECVDLNRSTFQPQPGGLKGLLESFHVDESKVGANPIFRLKEKPTLIVINADLRKHLRETDLGGVRLRHTKTYDGF